MTHMAIKIRMGREASGAALLHLVYDAQAAAQRGGRRALPVEQRLVAQVDAADSGLRGVATGGGRRWSLVPRTIEGPKAASHVTRGAVASGAEAKP